MVSIVVTNDTKSLNDMAISMKYMVGFNKLAINHYENLFCQQLSNYLRQSGINDDKIPKKQVNALLNQWQDLFLNGQLPNQIIVSFAQQAMSMGAKIQSSQREAFMRQFADAWYQQVSNQIIATQAFRNTVAIWQQHYAR